MTFQLVNHIGCQILTDMARDLTSVVTGTFQGHQTVTPALRDALKTAIRGTAVVQMHGAFAGVLNDYLVDILLQHVDAAINNTFWRDTPLIDPGVITEFQMAITEGMYQSLELWECRYDPGTGATRWWHPRFGYDGACRC